ncbi:MAG: sulfur carrier protein ThiS [Oscillospiraceae bacterium]|nr:sulfur carrier protein ThiS [Oscillospiraceae bacterium]
MFINGEKFEFTGEITISDLLKTHGFDCTRVAVERGGVIVRKGEFDSTKVVDGDKLEIVTFVGGG